jgi:hypothetical protein
VYIIPKRNNYSSNSNKTRGSQEPVIAHLVFNLTSKVEIENGGVTHDFESGPPKDYFNSNF